MKATLLVLAFAIQAVQEPGPWRIVYMQDGKFHSVKEDGTGLRVETDIALEKGIPSPDGKRRAGIHQGESASIWVSDADGKNGKRLTSETLISSLGWSPDGLRLVFASSGPQLGKWHIWIIDADGKNLTRLTDHGDGATDPRVSPAGNCVSYRELHQRPREKLPPSTLRTMDLSGKQGSVLLEKAQILDHGWSPKGDRVVVSLVQEVRILEPESGKSIKSFKLDEIHKDLYSHAAHGVVWRPDAGAIACGIRFLGGRMEGTKIFGDDQIFILPMEGKPVIIETDGQALPVRWIR